LSRQSFRQACLLATCLLALGAGAAAAQTLPQTDPPTADAGEVFSLGTLFVTGEDNAPPHPATEVYVTQEEMQLFERRRVSDALNLLPGMMLNPGNRGGSRNETGVYLRGFDLSRTPVLVDGFPVYVPYDGYIDLGRLLTGNLSTIEVSKGYASVLYGPNALGGVINLVTKRPEEPLEGEVVAGIDLAGNGDFKGYRLEGHLGMRADQWYLQADAAGSEQNFFRLSEDFDPGLYEDGGAREQSHTGDFAANVKLGYQPTALDEYVLGVALQRGSKEAPPYAGDDPSEGVFFDWPYYDKTSVYLSTNTAWSDTGYTKTRIYWDSFDNALERYDDEGYDSQDRPYAFSSRYDDDTFGGMVESGFAPFAGNRMAGSFQVKYDIHREHGVGEPVSVMSDLTVSLGLEDRHEITDQLAITAGIGYDLRVPQKSQDPATDGEEDFETETQRGLNLQMGLDWRFATGQRAWASISRKVRFATLFERYSYRLGFAEPNPGLEPETSINYEIGYEGQVAKRTTLQAALFAADVDNYIQNVTIGTRPFPPFSPITQQQNVGEALFYGLELGLRSGVTEDLELGFNYTYLVREATGDSDVPLYGTPHHKLFAYANWMIDDQWSVTPSLYFQSRMDTSDTDGGQTVDGYVLADIKVSFEPFDGTILEAGVRNLTDQDYEFDDGFPGEGRNYFITLRQRF